MVIMRDNHDTERTEEEKVRGSIRIVQRNERRETNHILSRKQSYNRPTNTLFRQNPRSSILAPHLMATLGTKPTTSQQSEVEGYAKHIQRHSKVDCFTDHELLFLAFTS